MSKLQAIPAAVSWETQGVLPPLEWNWVHIMEIVKVGLKNEKPYVILPVDEACAYKPQRVRLIKDDKTSPRGLVQRDGYAKQRYSPYLAARFAVDEVAAYAAIQFHDLPAEELERMADEFLQSLDT